MIDEFAKEYLLDDLRQVRSAVLGKLDGLSDWDIRRPLTSTGTNLLGLVKHLAVSEAWYLGDIWGRPGPVPHPRWDDQAGRQEVMWATEHESRDEIVARYRRIWEHSDETVAAHDIDDVTEVPWWPRPRVMLFNILVHLLSETNRHAGHADILREQLDGATGVDIGSGRPGRDADFWVARRRTIEQAASAYRPSPSP